MEKLKHRKRRALIIIDGESLAPHQHYDLSFLESEKRLDLWFFFKTKIQHSFTLHKDYNAKNIVLPRYEEDTLSYIVKRVCYEMGRRTGRYYKLYFIGDAHPVWEGIVQFFREKGYVAHHLWIGDYLVKKVKVEESAPPEATESLSPSLNKKLKGKTASKPPVDAAVLGKIRENLQQVTAGHTFSKKEFIQWLHQIGISVRKDVRGRRIRGLVSYLAAENLISYKPESQEVVVLPYESQPA
jgi:hypothetical protein